MREEKVKKGNAALYVVLLIVVVGMMVALKTCVGGDSAAEKASTIADHGDTIRVAIEYSPMMCYTYDDTLGGFNYDLLRLISKKENRPMKFYPMVALQKALSDLENGAVDLIVAQFPVTKENRSKLLFTDEVYIDRQVLVQRKTSDGAVSVRNQLDLAGKTVWIVKGSPMKERIINLGDEIGDSINVEEDALYGPEQLFLQVATGEIEYAVINGRIAKFMAPKYGNVDISTSISFSQIQAWAMHINNTELQTQINGWLKSMKETDDYKALYNRYFDEEK